MAPKKRKAPAAPKARAKSTIEKTVLKDWRPPGADEMCGACLLPIEDGVNVGRIDSCAHAFCYSCIERWSQTENSCPQCKLRFFWMASYAPSGQRQSLTRVKQRDQEGEEDDAFEAVQACEACKEVGDESTLLLCDGMHGTCNAAYHFRCVGLSAVPRGSWFCPDCVDRGFDADAHGRRSTRPRFCQPARPDAATGDDGGGGASSSSAGPRAVASEELLPDAGKGPETPEAEASPIGPEADPSSAEARQPERPPPAPQVAQPGPVNPFDPPARVSPFDPPALPAPAATPARPAAAQMRSAGSRASLPAHLRQGALTCVTPLVDLPAFGPSASSGPGSSSGSTAASSGRSGSAGGANAGSSGSGGLFASFVNRRKTQRGDVAAKKDQATSFIKLDPKYEEDFMGK